MFAYVIHIGDSFTCNSVGLCGVEVRGHPKFSITLTPLTCQPKYGFTKKTLNTYYIIVTFLFRRWTKAKCFSFIFGEVPQCGQFPAHSASDED